MVWVVVVLFGGFAVGFAVAADRWHQRALFWKGMYDDTMKQTRVLLDATDRFLEVTDSEVVRVWGNGTK